MKASEPGRVRLPPFVAAVEINAGSGDVGWRGTSRWGILRDMARRSLITQALIDHPDATHLDSLDDGRVERWRRLGLYQAFRQEEGAFQVEGVRPIELLLDAGVYPLESLILVSEEIAHREAAMQRRVGGLLEAATKAGVPVIDVTRPLFRKIANVKKLRGVMAIARRGSWTPEGLVEGLAEGGGLGLATLGVTDPGNLGTLIRSAHAFGAGALLTLEGSTDPFHPKTIRGSAGHLLPAASGTWEAIRDDCRRRGVELIGLQVGGDRSIPLDSFEADRSRPTLVCVGSEGSGFPAGVAGFDRTVSIAMSPGTDSLNVAVAGSLLLWRLRRPLPIRAGAPRTSELS